MNKALFILPIICFLFTDCRKATTKECGVVIQISTEQPVDQVKQDTITAIILVQFPTYQRTFVIREDAAKYPYTYWQQTYPVDAIFCIETPKR